MSPINSNRLEKFALVVQIAFLFICLWQTHRLLSTHFTHIDDTGVAQTLLLQKPSGSGCEEYFQKIRAKTQLNFSFIEKPVCTAVLWQSRLYTIPGQWTYAPLQFWLTQALLDPRLSYSYEEIKYWGRLPSFGFYLLGILAFFGLLRKCIPDLGAKPIIVSVLTLTLAFSLEFRIMAAQMESYAIGILSNCFALFGLIRLLNISAHSIRSVLLSALLLALSIAMQYQAVLLVAAGLVALVLCYWHFQILWKERWKVFTVLLATPMAAYGLVGDIWRLKDRGVMWNAGLANEYQVNSLSAPERMVELIQMLWQHTTHNLYSVVSAIELPDGLADLFGLALLFLIIVGFYNLYRLRSQSTGFFLLIFSAVYLLIYGSFVFFGKLTYSPTRHLLYFLPIILIWMGYGLALIRTFVPQSTFRIGLFSAASIYLCISIWSFHGFAEKRMDLLHESTFTEILSDAKPDFVVLGVYDRDPLFFQAAKSVPMQDYLDGPVCKNGHRFLIPNNQRLYFLWYSKRNEIHESDTVFLKYLADLIQNCSEPAGRPWQKVSIRKLKDYQRVYSQTEIDLSNRTKNGANNYFIQLYELENGAGSHLYPASLEEGIDFRKLGLPNFLKHIKGLAQSENWGRWSDAHFAGNIVEFGFRKPLPNRFILELQAISYANNDQLPTKIRVGNQEQSIYIGKDPQKAYRLAFNNASHASIIEVIPPNPMYPRQIDPQNQDPRKLGIGFISLNIKPLSN